MAGDRVVVFGSATRAVEPDLASLSVRVKELDADQRVAFERCVPRMNELVMRLSDLVGADGRVAAEQVRVQRDWDEFAEERRQIRQAASATVAVECAPEIAAQLVTEAMALGVDEVAGLRYSLKDAEPVLEELLTEAVTAAHRKARRLAEAAARSLGKVLVVEERSRRSWDDDDDDGVVLLSGGGGDDGLALRPAQLKFAVAVRVTYAFGDA